MTYAEACRVAEECARWIKNADAERVRKLEQLDKASRVIFQAIDIAPISADPFTPDPDPVAQVVPFAHPDDVVADEPHNPFQPPPETYANGVRYDG